MIRNAGLRRGPVGGWAARSAGHVRVSMAALLVAALALSPFLPCPARAQDEISAAPDTLFERGPHAPVIYETSYDRDISSGVWSQTLTYGVSGKRMVLGLTGTYTTIDYTAVEGLGAGNGGFDGRLNYRLTRNWYVNLGGRYDKISSSDLISESTLRRNRLKASTQYNLTAMQHLVVRALLSTELQEDHTLNRRPLDGQLRTFPILDAAGDTVAIDTIRVDTQRDSTLTSGRQDGASLQAEWRPKPWLAATAQAAGNRITPVTTSSLRDFGNDPSGAPTEHVSEDRLESPNDYTSYQARVDFSRFRQTPLWISANSTERTQQYFDKQLRAQEHISFDQSAGMLHLEYSPIRGGQIMLEGKLDRTLSEYALRTNRTSLVTGRTLRSGLNYLPTLRTRMGAQLELVSSKNERQFSQNGRNIAQSLQVNGAHGVSRRFVVDAAGSVSLFSYQYEDPVSDRDNQTTYVNAGGGYGVSARCSTQVHFSTNRSHTIAIDPSQSGNNNVQTTYQLNAILQLRTGRSLRINQTYVLNAVYQIYDAEAAEGRNVLSRIRRIDTVLQDSLYPFASLRLIHNFLFRDSGSYTRPAAGGDRRYNVASETYQQNLGLSVFVRPVRGIELSVSETLGNTVTNLLSQNRRVVDNKWNLQAGAAMDLPIGSTASLRGSVQHVAAYTERANPAAPLNDQRYWTAGIGFHKDF